MSPRSPKSILLSSAFEKGQVRKKPLEVRHGFLEREVREKQDGLEALAVWQHREFPSLQEMELKRFP